MKIGYPCLNRSIGCSASRKFRLASLTDERLAETVAANLECLGRILRFNAAEGVGFFRISSETVPFASHPDCRLDWRGRFEAELAALGRFIRRHRMRISMHPDQFVLINALDPAIVRRSAAELGYHAALLDALGLDLTAKIQIHIGGAYGDKAAAMDRFAAEWKKLPGAVRRRLVIENDDRLYRVRDCLEIHLRTGIPVLFDAFHHACLNQCESLRDALTACAATWKKRDGPPMVDYSSQAPERRRGAHVESLEARHFRAFLHRCSGIDFDLMLEVKDKEKSAALALRIAGARKAEAQR
jgi:UV DNA damage endonuclease